VAISTLHVHSGGARIRYLLPSAEVVCIADGVRLESCVDPWNQGRSPTLARDFSGSGGCCQCVLVAQALHASVEERQRKIEGEREGGEK